MLQWEAVIAELRSLASAERRQRALRTGAATEPCLGVSKADIRRLAKTVGRNQPIAEQLWRSDLHDGRLLAVLVADWAQVSDEELESWLARIDSWELCDTLAKELATRRPTSADLISSWSADERLYVRRAALSLIANLAVHRATECAGRLHAYLAVIDRCAADPRAHVQSAASWALRELGKADVDMLDAAVELAAMLIARGGAAKKVGTAAMKELGSLSAVPERRRLLLSTRATARKHER